MEIKITPILLALCLLLITGTEGAPQTPIESKSQTVRSERHPISFIQQKLRKRKLQQKLRKRGVGSQSQRVVNPPPTRNGPTELKPIKMRLSDPVAMVEQDIDGALYQHLGAEMAKIKDKIHGRIHDRFRQTLSEIITGSPIEKKDQDHWKTARIMDILTFQIWYPLNSAIDEWFSRNIDDRMALVLVRVHQNLIQSVLNQLLEESTSSHAQDQVWPSTKIHQFVNNVMLETNVREIHTGELDNFYKTFPQHLQSIIRPFIPEMRNIDQLASGVVPPMDLDDLEKSGVSNRNQELKTESDRFALRAKHVIAKRILDSESRIKEVMHTALLQTIGALQPHRDQDSQYPDQDWQHATYPPPTQNWHQQHAYPSQDWQQQAFPSQDRQYEYPPQDWRQHGHQYPPQEWQQQQGYPPQDWQQHGHHYPPQDWQRQRMYPPPQLEWNQGYQYPQPMHPPSQFEWNQGYQHPSRDWQRQQMYSPSQHEGNQNYELHASPQDWQKEQTYRPPSQQDWNQDNQYLPPPQDWQDQQVYPYHPPTYNDPENQQKVPDDEFGQAGARPGTYIPGARPGTYIPGARPDTNNGGARPNTVHSNNQNTHLGPDRFSSTHNLVNWLNSEDGTNTQNNIRPEAGGERANTENVRPSTHVAGASPNANTVGARPNTDHANTPDSYLGQEHFESTHGLVDWLNREHDPSNPPQDNRQNLGSQPSHDSTVHLHDQLGREPARSTNDLFDLLRENPSAPLRKNGGSISNDGHIPRYDSFHGDQQHGPQYHFGNEQPPISNANPNPYQYDQLLSRFDQMPPSSYHADQDRISQISSQRNYDRQQSHASVRSQDSFHSSRQDPTNQVPEFDHSRHRSQDYSQQQSQVSGVHPHDSRHSPQDRKYSGVIPSHGAVSDHPSQGNNGQLSQASSVHSQDSSFPPPESSPPQVSNHRSQGTDEQSQASSVHSQDSSHGVTDQKSQGHTSQVSTSGSDSSHRQASPPNNPPQSRLYPDISDYKNSDILPQFQKHENIRQPAQSVEPKTVSRLDWVTQLERDLSSMAVGNDPTPPVENKGGSSPVQTST